MAPGPARPAFGPIPMIGPIPANCVDDEWPGLG